MIKLSKVCKVIIPKLVDRATLPAFLPSLKVNPVPSISNEVEISQNINKAIHVSPYVFLELTQHSYLPNLANRVAVNVNIDDDRKIAIFQKFHRRNPSRNDFNLHNVRKRVAKVPPNKNI